MPETPVFRNQTQIVKLLGVQRELLEQLAACNKELDTLMAGGAGIGVKMKQLFDAFDLAWCGRYAKGRTKGYVWNRREDPSNIKRLALRLEPQDLADRAIRYLQSDDPFFVNSKHSFGLFTHSINQWVAPAAATSANDDVVASELARTNARRKAIR